MKAMPITFFLLSDILPTHYLTIHQSAIRAIAWIRAPPLSGSGASLITENPTVIASGGYDGVECLTDIRDLHGNVMNRTRGKYAPETPMRASWFINDA